MAVALLLWTACAKDRRGPAPRIEAKPEATPAQPVQHGQERPIPPDPGHARLVFSGALERSVDSPGVQCADDDSSVWVTSADVEGRKASPPWMLSIQADGVVRLAVGRWGKQLVTYQAPASSAMRRSGRTIQIDGVLTAAGGATVTLSGQMECERMPQVPVPEAIVKLLQEVSNKTVLRYSTYQGGSERYPGAISALVPVNEARALVGKVRARVPAGWVVFQGTTFWEHAKEKDAEVVVGPGAGQMDILRIARSDAANYGMMTEGLIKQLAAWDQAYGIDIFHAENDTIELSLKNRPADMLGFARDVYDFCPDVVEQGVGTVEELAKAISETGEVYLWWD